MKLHPIIFSFVAILLSMMLSTFASAATLVSSVNRNQISTNETLTLRVLLDEQVDASELNLDSLDEGFEVLNVTPQTRSSFNVVNGQSEKSASTLWTITLVAKNEGVLMIPAFTVKSASSQPISITVNNAAKNRNTSIPLDVVVASKVKKAYVNQQFIIEIELSANSNVRDLNGPQLIIEGADVEAFDQQTFQRVDNGISRNIVILKYAVFPQQEGKLTVPVMTYTGLQNGRRSVFGSTGTQVVARSKQFTIPIEAPPTNNIQAWFPASGVTISSTWSADKSKLKVGEPITRSITIVANGQQGSAIPPLIQVASPNGLKSYKDQAQLNTTKSAQGFIGTRVESEAIVANASGDFILPAVSINWWNTEKGRWEISTLEPETLTVSGEALPLNVGTHNNALNSSLTSEQVVRINAKSDARWQLLSLVLAIIILIQFYFLIRRYSTPSRVQTIETSNLSEKAAWSSLQSALQSGESGRIRTDILIWGRHALNSDSPVNLATIALAGNSSELSQALNNLDKHLYNGADKPDHRVLNDLLIQLRKTLSQSKEKNGESYAKLKPLYPT